MSHTNEVDVVANAGWDERIIVCRNGDLVETAVVVTERYVVVVDTMINEAAAAQLLAQARPHLNDGRSLLVLNTHADYDHVWGNQLFAARGTPIVGRRNSVPIFFQPDAVALLEQLRADEPEIFGDVTPTPPTILFDEALTVDGGDLTLELFATPGHTVDHTSLYIPEIDTLLAADAAEFPYPMARTTDGLPEMRASLGRLAALGAETVLYCHAPAETGPQMAGQLLHDNVAYFNRLERACREALAQGVAADPPAGADVVDLVGLTYEAAVPGEERWHEVHDYYRTDGHARQLRQMLASLAA